jgi:hypothetical protein
MRTDVTRAAGHEDVRLRGGCLHQKRFRDLLSSVVTVARGWLAVARFRGLSGSFPRLTRGREGGRGLRALRGQSAICANRSGYVRGSQGACQKARANRNRVPDDFSALAFVSNSRRVCVDSCISTNAVI